MLMLICAHLFWLVWAAGSVIGAYQGDFFWALWLWLWLLLRFLDEVKTVSGSYRHPIRKVIFSKNFSLRFYFILPVVAIFLGAFCFLFASSVAV